MFRPNAGFLVLGLAKRGQGDEIVSGLDESINGPSGDDKGARSCRRKSRFTVKLLTSLLGRIRGPVRDREADILARYRQLRRELQPGSSIVLRTTETGDPFIQACANCGSLDLEVGEWLGEAFSLPRVQGHPASAGRRLRGYPANCLEHST